MRTYGVWKLRSVRLYLFKARSISMGFSLDRKTKTNSIKHLCFVLDGNEKFPTPALGAISPGHSVFKQKFKNQSI